MNISRSSAGGSESRRVVATALCIAASVLVVRGLYFLFPNVFEPWNAQIVDRLFLVRAASPTLRPHYDSTVVHVDISDRTVRRMQNSYQGRSDYARVIRNLGELGTASQVWDFIFAARTNPVDDSIFIRSTSLAGNVYFGLAFELYKKGQTSRVVARNTAEENFLLRQALAVSQGGDGDLYQAAGAFTTFLDLARESKGVGFLNINADRDGVYRRAPLLIRFDGMLFPSIALRSVCDYLGVTPDNVAVMPGKSLTLKHVHRPNVTPHDIVIPIDREGNMVINYVGSWEAMKHFDFADVFQASDDRDEMEMLAEEFAGRIAIVSQVTTGSADVGPVPTDPNFPKSGIHANVMNTILTENFMRELDAADVALTEAVIVIILFLVSLRLSSRWFFVSMVGFLLLYVGGSLGSFFYSNLIPNIVQPSLVIVFSLLTIMAYRYVQEEKQKEVLRRSFESYFAPAVVKKIMANPEVITAGGQKKELSIMFTDIKSFTTYSAQLAPDVVRDMLSEYFGAMMDIVFHFGGTVDKLIGDGLMVFFGDPEPQEDHALRCVNAAVEMQKKVRELRARWELEGKMPIQIRIGINTGVVVVGNMGSLRRLSYTALGSGVNLAQRLEANAPVGGIMISHRTYDLVKDHVPTRSLGEIQVKGLDKPVAVYEIVLQEGTSLAS